MIGNTLRKLRREKKMTQETLAVAVGTSKQTIQRYESGVIANIPPERIEALALALGTTPSVLMGWEPEKNVWDEAENLFPIMKKRLPILGEIACGQPIYAAEEHEAYATAEGDLDADFCLRAHGDSMIGARIFDGDIVFIRSQESVDNGDIAAVIIREEATLKRVYYYPEEGKLILTPENPRYEPLVYLGDDLNSIRILGKAVAFQSTVR